MLQTDSGSHVEGQSTCPEQSLDQVDQTQLALWRKVEAWNDTSQLVCLCVVMHQSELIANAVLEQDVGLEAHEVSV